MLLMWTLTESVLSAGVNERQFTLPIVRHVQLQLHQLEQTQQQKNIAWFSLRTRNLFHVYVNDTQRLRPPLAARKLRSVSFLRILVHFISFALSLATRLRSP